MLSIIPVTLSLHEYEKTVLVTRINDFLGELVNGTAVMNVFAYDFVLFGALLTSVPWRSSSYGHHLGLNILCYRTQIMISPWSAWAESNYHR